jgi:signal transduction histidine kinase
MLLHAKQTDPAFLLRGPATATPRPEPPAPAPGKVNLLRSFSLRAFISIALVWGTTSMVVSRSVEHHLVARDALVLQQLVAEITLQHDPAIWFSAEEAREGSDLDSFFRELARLPDIGRIDAFAADGSLVWSSADTRPEATVEHSALQLALTGLQTHEKIALGAAESVDPLTKAATVDWMIRHYIPIADRETNRVFGVIKLQRIPIALDRAIRDARRLVWLCELGGGLFLYLTLFWIVRRAHSLIQQQQTALLDSARLAAVGEMASSVAHSIRNPVASIRSSAELALEESPPRAVADGLEDIVAQVERFDGWIQELLTFAGERADPAAHCALAPVVDAAIGAFRGRASRQHVGIEPRIAPDLPDVRGDARELTQVLHSLFANALNAMPDGGDLIVEAARSSDGIRLCITDSGFGIPADRLEGCFEPLARHRPDGLGIGLALAQQIIERYGGCIALHSAVGVGTSVVLDLRASGPTVAAAGHLSAPRIRRKPAAVAAPTEAGESR